MAGLGSYAYRKLGWRRAVTVADADDDLFSWTQTAGFDAEFCALGGTIVKRVWVPKGTSHYSSVVAQIPSRGVDGIVVVGETKTAIAVASRYPGLRGDLGRKLIIGALDGSGDLESLGPRADRLLWSGYFFPRPSPSESAYNGDLDTYFRELDGSEQIWDFGYHAAMAATVAGLNAVHGDLSGGERRFMAALARVRLRAPTGPVRLDSSRQAVGSNYIATWTNNVVLATIPGVEHTFGGYFGPNDPPPSRTGPVCKPGNPPPWAR